jgi:imidazoleglycerol-phosphate dehydratase/histidinol-phosphatase
MPEKVLFVDRDGTLIHEPGDYQVDALDKVHLVDHVIPSLLELSNHGYRFVMITNQDGLGTDFVPTGRFRSAACTDDGPLREPGHTIR